jgi:membrane protein
MSQWNGQNLRQLIAATYEKWNRHNAPRLGASLAYYTLLSMAPLSVLLVAICGLVFGHATAQHRIVEHARDLIGPGGANALRMMLANAHRPGAGIFAALVALVTLLFGASGVFLELRSALNTIWEAPPPQSTGWRGFVRQRLASFGMILGLGSFLLLSLLLSTTFAVIERFARGAVPLPAAIVGEVLNLLISLIALTALFSLVFKFVPNVAVAWREVTVGAAVTAALFMLGKSLLAIYLSTAAVGSTYGAAGSVVAFVVWVYYSAQIFFFGAVFTRVYSEKLGASAKAGRLREAERKADAKLSARSQTA